MDIRVRLLPVLIAVFAIFGIAAVGSTPSTSRTAAERRNNQEPLQTTADESRSVWDGLYTEEQSKLGQGVYMEECSTCHSEMLTGSIELAAPALLGDEFMTAWNGLTAGDLFEQIRTSMPQQEPGKLSLQQYADVLAFIFSANKFPTGQKALDSDVAALKLIRVEKRKPEGQ